MKMCEQCHRYPADDPANGVNVCSACLAERSGVVDPTSNRSEDKLRKLRTLFERAITLLRCVEADLQGILPEFEPSGNRMHPAWATLKEIKEFLKEVGEDLPSAYDAEQERLEDALEACRALVSAHSGGRHGDLIDWGDLNYAHKLALKAVGEEQDIGDGDSEERAEEPS